MKGRVGRREAARNDLKATYRRYVREAGIRTADRFLASAEAIFLRLAAMPGLGTHLDLEDIPMGGLRFLPLGSPFQVYLVFYRSVEGGVEIARILHGARDIPTVLAEEFDGEDDEENEADDDGME